MTMNRRGFIRTGAGANEWIVARQFNPVLLSRNSSRPVSRRASSLSPIVLHCLSTSDENANMTENVENLLLEHLEALRNELRYFKTESIAELVLIKQRLTSLESQVAGVHSDMALIHGRIDRVDSSIDRIERRLELQDDVH